MRFLFAFYILLIGSSFAYGKAETDSLFNKLDKAIAATDRIDADKLKKIEDIRRSLIPQHNLIVQFNLYSKLYEEYKLFNFDSAFNAAKKLEDIATQLNDASRIIASKNKLSFVLLSAGLYKEAYDYLSTINVAGHPDSIKAEFYTSLGRYYYDLSDYNNDSFYSSIYITKGNAYIDSALGYYPKTSFEWNYYIGLKNLKEGKLDKAYASFQSLINRSNLGHHQLA
ncbi:MAG TPA: tetratricopeptide repeat protein, partial [Flavisolibacter sp.]|nr:tetratricopeptide repeat protein [Flavisolibacter sp.]